MSSAYYLPLGMPRNGLSFETSTPRSVRDCLISNNATVGRNTKSQQPYRVLVTRILFALVEYTTLHSIFIVYRFCPTAQQGSSSRVDGSRWLSRYDSIISYHDTLAGCHWLSTDVPDFVIHHTPHLGLERLLAYR